MNKLFTIIVVSTFLSFLFLLNILLFLNPSVFQLLYPKLTEPDKFGWSSDVQLQQASDIATMLLNEQKFETDQLSQYQIKMTDAENNHMNDVGKLLKIAKNSAAFVAGILVAILTKARSAKKTSRVEIQKLLKKALAVYLVISVLGCLATFALWTTLFTTFHTLLFTPGTWSFPFDSTLIRLFPETFWQKTFVLLIVLPAMECVCFYLLTLLPSRSFKSDKITQ